MKQNYNSKNCLAIVAAMAFEEMVEYVQLFFRSDEVTEASVSDFIEYAKSKGRYVGHIFSRPKVYFNKIIQAYDINNNPALVIVTSRYNAENQHALYWNGSKIMDPDPGVPDGKSFSEYNILAWLPIN